MAQAGREIAELVEVQFFPPLPQPEAVQVQALIVTATVKTELAAVRAVAEQHIIGYLLVLPLIFLVKEPAQRELLVREMQVPTETKTDLAAVAVAAQARPEIRTVMPKVETAFLLQ